MQSKILVRYHSLTLQAGDCVEVKGETADEKPEVWFAKIVRFHLDNKESEVVDISNLEGAMVDVRWFYDPKDVLKQLPGIMKDPELHAIKQALNGAPHLLGTVPESIPVSTIQDVIFPVNVSALCVTRPEKASTVFYRWIYFDKAEGKSIVGFCSWFRKQWLKKPSNRKQKSGVQNTALGTGSGRFPKPYGSVSGVSAKSYTELEAFVKMPLLKGGPFGQVGTVPLVFSATRTLEKIQREGGATKGDWQGLLDEDLGSSYDNQLEKLSLANFGLLTSIVTCPECHQKF
ncbi:hypothetical protein BJ322DRAFT_1025840 [Thelephora terrestris]|uniref:BAH domain-containing protein n=1 Tax=Thelephora terrestris TaxID=56493 RepID=A0A9P6H1U8_9AGAM|nr:hypothetical protein BJ322DRAFT_1025840 [Thelephora terrestris]